MVAITFNATDVDPSTGGQDIFETGEYSFQIVKSEVAKTKKGGTMLVFEMACLDEGFSGKRTFARLNVQNENTQAVEIAYRDLSAICHVCGVLNMTDTQQLHGKPFRARIEKTTYSKEDGREGHGNEIKAYLDMNGNPPQKGVAAGAAAAAPTAPQPPAAPTAPVAAPPAPPAAPAAPPSDQVAAPPATEAPPAAPANPPWAQSAPPAAPAEGANLPPWQQNPAG